MTSLCTLSLHFLHTAKHKNTWNIKSSTNEFWKFYALTGFCWQAETANDCNHAKPKYGSEKFDQKTYFQSVN